MFFMVISYLVVVIHQEFTELHLVGPLDLEPSLLDPFPGELELVCLLRREGLCVQVLHSVLTFSTNPSSELSMFSLSESSVSPAWSILVTLEDPSCVLFSSRPWLGSILNWPLSSDILSDHGLKGAAG